MDIFTPITNAECVLSSKTTIANNRISSNRTINRTSNRTSNRTFKKRKNMRKTRKH